MTFFGDDRFVKSASQLTFTISWMNHSFSALQADRISVYRDWNTGFKMFKEGEATPEDYAQLLATLTPIFQGINLAITDLLSSCPPPLGVDQMKTIQELEALHFKRMISWQSLVAKDLEGDVDMSLSILEAGQEVADVKDEIRVAMSELALVLAEEQDLEQQEHLR